MPGRIEKLKERLSAGELVLCDGAWATQMQKMGLQSGDCPEEWNITQPDKIRQIAREYFQAGSQVCLTNTFGGTKFRLMRHGFADKVEAFNRAGAALCREVAESFGGIVAASVGPTGEFVQPEGLLSEKEMYDAFREQIGALKAGGADAVCIETMYVLDEALLAVKAAREHGMFCIACMTFDSTPDGFKTMLGTSIEDATCSLDVTGADVVGTNCGNGIADMVRIAHRMRMFTKKPLIVKSNAGIPEMVGGQIVYHESPEMMAARLVDLKSAGVALVGGCCGTTPEYIRVFRQSIEKLNRGEVA